MIKKYYCPWCGEKTFSTFDKMILGPRTTFGSRLKCSACGNEICFKGNIFSFVFYGVFILSVLFIIFLKPTKSISVLIITITWLLHVVCSVFFTKFIKQDERTNDKYYHCNLEMTDKVKSSTMYFYTTAVVQALFDGESKCVPIRIEPLEINAKCVECKFAFVETEPEFEFTNKKVTLYDNNIIVALGSVENGCFYDGQKSIGRGKTE